MLFIFLSHVGVKAGDEQSLYIYYKVYEWKLCFNLWKII